MDRVRVENRQRTIPVAGRRQTPRLDVYRPSIATFFRPLGESTKENYQGHLMTDEEIHKKALAFANEMLFPVGCPLAEHIREPIVRAFSFALIEFTDDFLRLTIEKIYEAAEPDTQARMRAVTEFQHFNKPN
jgi:hypothetical protein